jgi:hypothetical protein
MKFFGSFFTKCDRPQSASLCSPVGGGQSFVIVHIPSGKLVRPFCGKQGNDTNLVLCQQESSDCLFTFQSCEKAGYSYIQHKDSGKFVHPYRGFKHPWNNTNLVIYENFHKACRFRHFPDQNVI